MEGETFAGGRNSWFTGYFLSNLAGGLISPLIPLFVVVYLGLSVFYVGLTTSIVSLASIPSLIAWGNVSDSVKKRKPFIMIGFVGSFVALIPIYLATSLTTYMLLQVIFQVLAMAAVPVSTMIIIENVEKSKWPVIMSSFNLIASLGTLLGLLAGTLLMTIYSGSPAILVRLYEIASFIYLLAAIATHIMIPEPARAVQRSNLRTLHTVRMTERIRFFPSAIIHFVGLTRGVRGAGLDRDIRTYLFSTFFLMTAFQLYFVPFPVFLLDYLKGADSTSIFVMYMMNSLLGTLAYRFTGPVITRFGVRNVLAGTLAIRAVLFSSMAAVPFFLSSNLPYLDMALVFYGVMGGLWGFIGISEVSYISRMAKENAKGKAIGYYNSLNGLGQIVGGIISGVLCLEFGYGVDFIAASAMVVAGAALMVRITKDEGYKPLFGQIRQSV